jgi:hypothetical protein
MTKYANDDMFIPVMPRILDPSLKFTENSILDSLEKSRINFKEDSLKKKDSHIIDMPVSVVPKLSTEKKSVITVIAKYKIHIILLISIILLVVIIYYVYKKYKSDKNPKVEEKLNITSSDNQLNTECIENVKKVDNDKISSYLSNYINTDGDSDSDEESEKGGSKELNTNVVIVDRNNKGISDKGKVIEIFENIEVEEVDIIIPKNLSSIEEIEEGSEDNDWDSHIDFQPEEVILEGNDNENKEEEEIVEVKKVDVLLEDAEPQDNNPIDIFNKYK